MHYSSILGKRHSFDWTKVVEKKYRFSLSRGKCIGENRPSSKKKFFFNNKAIQLHTKPQMNLTWDNNWPDSLNWTIFVCLFSLKIDSCSSNLIFKKTKLIRVVKITVNLWHAPVAMALRSNHFLELLTWFGLKTKNSPESKNEITKGKSYKTQQIYERIFLIIT